MFGKVDRNVIPLLGLRLGHALEVQGGGKESRSHKCKMLLYNYQEVKEQEATSIIYLSFRLLFCPSTCNSLLLAVT